MAEVPAGPILDRLGVTFDVEDGDQLTEVLVIAKATDFDTGDTALILATSTGLDWIDQHGLLQAASLILGRE